MLKVHDPIVTSADVSKIRGLLQGFWGRLVFVHEFGSTHRYVFLRIASIHIYVYVSNCIHIHKYMISTCKNFFFLPLASNHLHCIPNAWFEVELINPLAQKVEEATKESWD